MTINEPAIIEVLFDELNYDKYEKENKKQEYYDLIDFQGYYYEILIPVIDSIKIKRIKMHNKYFYLNFVNRKKESFFFDTADIHERQGLILFNGEKPIFWKGNRSDDLVEFIRSYFKK